MTARSASAGAGPAATSQTLPQVLVPDVEIINIICLCSTEKLSYEKVDIILNIVFTQMLRETLILNLMH